MKLARVFVCSALAAATLVASPRTAQSGWPNDPGANFRFAPSPGNQSGPIATDDGQGGAFIVWAENDDVRAQHVTAQGLIAPGWPSSGIVLCNAPGGQYPTGLVPDGAGGFLVCWDDYRVAQGDAYVQRVSSAGVPYWTANGVAACSAGGNQYNTRVCPDRAGGAIVTWSDERNYFLNSLDVYAQHIDAAGSPTWTAGGVSVAAVPQSQSIPVIVSDGTVGGCYIAWHDQRSGWDEIYAQRLDSSGAPRSGWPLYGKGVMVGYSTWAGYPVIAPDGAFGVFVSWFDGRGSGTANLYLSRLTASGTFAVGWPSGGLIVAGSPYDKYSPAIVPDGANGAVVAWEQYDGVQYDVYAQRMNGAGSQMWGGAGVALSLAPGDQSGLRLVSDGAGGAVAGFADGRAGHPPMLYAQRVLSDGSIAPGFAADGNAIATAHWVQGSTICSDGAGGAILAWEHIGLLHQGFAQRIDRWGHLGAQPRIASVRDVPNDQGGKVKVSWDRSPLDAWPDNRIANYSIFRSVPPNAALVALESGEAVIADGAATGRDAAAADASAPGKRAFVTTMLAGATVYWELVGSVYATQLAGYSFVAPTEQDSVPGSNPHTLFMVRAEDWGYNARWESDPDSAYSIDNLAPAAPAPFTGTYSEGTTYLHWQPNTEPDLAHYRLYRGASADFVPGPGSLVASPPDTGYADAGPAGWFYKLTAVDVNGNESGCALLTPEGTVDVIEGAPLALALEGVRPNPTTSSRMVVSFLLPSDVAARLELIDVRGRVVASRDIGSLGAGRHLVDLAGERKFGAGIYMVRLAQGPLQRTARVVVLD